MQQTGVKELAKIESTSVEGESDRNIQIIAPVGISRRKWRVVAALNSTKMVELLKRRRLKDTRSRKTIRSDRWYQHKVIDQVLKLIKRYPTDEINSTVFTHRKQCFNNPKNRPNPVKVNTVSAIDMSQSSFIQNRKGRRKLKREAIAAMTIVANTDQEKLNTLKQYDILLQDPPDSEKTFVPHTLTTEATASVEKLL